MKRAYAAAAMILFAFSLLQAEDAPKTPLRVLTRVDASGRLSASAERIASSLDAALVRLPRIVAVRRLGPGDNALEAAAAAVFDLIVELRVSDGASASFLRVSRSIREGSTGRVLEEYSEESPEPSENELSQTFWLTLLSVVEKSSPAPWPAAGTSLAGAPSPADAVRPWLIETGLYMAQFPDFWIGSTFLDERVFVKAGVYQFLGGVFFGSAYSSSHSGLSLVSLPLVQPGFAAGAYLFGPSAAFRPYLSFAAYLRVNVDPLNLDPIAPYGTTCMVGLERRIVKGVAAFLELGVAFYPFCDGYLLAASQSSFSEGPYAGVYGPSWFLEFPQFRFGVRVFL